MDVTFVVVPQWQGSGSSRAMRLVDGAEAIRGDLPSASTIAIEVPLEAGDSQATKVHRLSSLALVRDRFTEALASTQGAVITIGGDCGVELAAVARALDSDVALIWMDAHPDMNTPDSSESGAFNGMVLRTLLGDGAAGLVPSVTIDPSRVVLVGARAFDPAEEQYVSQNGIRVIDAEALSGSSLIEWVEATGASSVYIHIDLDVLDPIDIVGLSNPEPFGVSALDLIAAIRELVARFELRGAGVTEFAPATPGDAVEDMPTILRIVGALTSSTV